MVNFVIKIVKSKDFDIISCKILLLKYFLSPAIKIFIRNKMQEKKKKSSLEIILILIFHLFKTHCRLAGRSIFCGPFKKNVALTKIAMLYL